MSTAIAENGASLVVENIKNGLNGKSFKYVPPGTTEVDAITILVKDGKVYNKADNTEVRLVGVRWSYLATLFNEQSDEADRLPVADPMADVVGKNASPTAKAGAPKAPKSDKPKVRSSTPDGFDPANVTYYTTAAQKTVILNLQFGEDQAAADVRKKLMGQWDGKHDINSLAYLSYEEAMLLAPYYNTVKGANSLVNKSDWVRNSYDDHIASLTPPAGEAVADSTEAAE
jgi:hypothetical protein